MSSTFSGLEASKRGLSAHQQALHTTGHNVANADNKAFSRQRVQMGTTEPLYDASLNRAMVAGQIGQGVSVHTIERIRDEFLDDRIVETSTEKGYWDTREKYIRQVEIILNEPGGLSLRSHLDQFWSSWEELANYPEESAHRSVVKEKAIGLGSRIEDTFNRVYALKEQANREVENKTNLLNSMAESVRVLNERITKAEALGDNPNDLWDRRDKLVEDMATLADIHIGRSDKDEFMVFIGQQIFVQGSKKNEIALVANANYEGRLDLVWKNTGAKVLLRNGELEGLIEIRDVLLQEKINQMDSFAMNLKDTVNSIHKDGFGYNGKTNQDFFDVKNLSTNSFGDYDTDGDGKNDITAIFKVSGRTSLNQDNPIGIDGIMTFHKNDEKNTPVQISYSKDETLRAVIKKINDARVGVVAGLNHDNQLTLKAVVAEDHPSKNFMIRHLEDSGEFLVGLTGVLVGSGVGGSFDYRKIGELNKFQVNPEDVTLTPHLHPASFVRLTDEISNNTLSIAASRGKALGGNVDYNSAHGHKDGANALLIAAALREKPIMVEYDSNFTNFYSGMIAKLGTEGREAIQEASTRKLLMTEYENLRQSVSGVSLDEEMANMVQFQQSYNASARMINVQNEMLDTIINHLGVGR
ncbi:MAG: flagellar hook-associated protein FlgK [Leptospiraceae bacterium]|nr:flagellar hook-associated protein FlgK [Leptospiraceae bacterium]